MEDSKSEPSREAKIPEMKTDNPILNLAVTMLTIWLIWQLVALVSGGPHA